MFFSRRVQGGRPSTVAVAAAVATAVAAGACGTGNADPAAERGAGTAPPPGYAELEGVVTGARVPICMNGQGDLFVDLPSPSAESARERSYFRYLDGRIYEFGPCQVDERNELRVYRYDGPAARDAALADVSERGTRPTAVFVFEDHYAVEIWSPEPGLGSPLGQVAATVHATLGRLQSAYHPDAPGSPGGSGSGDGVSNCPPLSEPATVILPGFVFCPSELTVAVGTQVTWTNLDPTPHTATAAVPDGIFDSGVLAEGESFSFSFEDAGMFEYFCSLHPGMRGAIRVVA